MKMKKLMTWVKMRTRSRRWKDSGDLASAVKTPKAIAQDRSPESDHRRLRVLIFTQLIYL